MGVKTSSIGHLLNEIRAESIVLPDLQRDFVWKPSQTRQLFDSLMQDYPIGSLLLWETRFVDVYYRNFVDDVRDNMTFTPKLKAAGQAKRMVLDGQQRLQSFYLGVYGSYNGRRLYFDVTSGREADTYIDEDGEEVLNRYRFAFWRDEDIMNRPKRFIRVTQINEWANKFEEEEIKEVIQSIPLEGTLADQAARNMRRLRFVLSRADLVPVETIDEEVSRADQARSIREILEIFVRVNQGGTRLTQSDLMFSLIRVKWIGARRAFDELQEQVDSDHSLGIDSDYLIRGLLVVANAPVSFDVDTIDRHWDIMQPMFATLSAALKNSIDFCQDPDVGFFSPSLLQPIATLYPIIYYLTMQRNCSVPESERKNLRALIYFLLFNNFVRGKSPQARIRWLRDTLKDVRTGPVPIKEILDVVKERQKEYYIQTSVEMLNGNPRLALNIVQRQFNRQVLSWQSKVEVDHIFPQSAYRSKHPELVDDIGNFAYLGKLRNIRKSDEPPWEYFKNTSEKELVEDFLIEPSLLADDKFEEFVRVRRQHIESEVRSFLGR